MGSGCNISNTRKSTNNEKGENDLLFKLTGKKEIHVLLSGVEPKPFQLLVRMLYH